MTYRARAKKASSTLMFDFALVSRYFNPSSSASSCPCCSVITCGRITPTYSVSLRSVSKERFWSAPFYRSNRICFQSRSCWHLLKHVVRRLSAKFGCLQRTEEEISSAAEKQRSGRWRDWLLKLRSSVTS